jgi:palmitoyltransferase ZDHHC13/17
VTTFLYVLLGLSPVLLISFLTASLSDPGYLKPEHDFLELLQKVHACELCADCKVLVTARSKHCMVCNRCVERYDHHCPWINNCVGIHNHNSFLVFVITLLTICTIAVLSCLDMLDPNQDCDIKNNRGTPSCPNSEWCLGCSNYESRYTMTVISLSVTIFFGFAAVALFSVHIVNYIKGKTTNERFARQNRVASEMDQETRTNSSVNMLQSTDAEALL